MKNTPRFLFLLLCACAAMLVVAAPSMAKHNSRGDRNHDGLPDKWERANHLSLRVNQAKRDQDRDGLNNRGEFVAGTNPRDADTNGDGTDDGAEDAGTVVSFDAATGKLTIKPFNADPVVGLVTPDTEIECGDREEADNDAGDDNGGDHHGGNARAADHGGGGGGDDNGDNNDNQGQPGCDATMLTAGMVVREAELETTAMGLVFKKVELVPAAPTQPAPRSAN
jgi:hypothetical protein